MQNYTSANTSVNSTKVPAVFTKMHWVLGPVNLDFGGGKYDTATKYLENFAKKNLIYDPYNRSDEHNMRVVLGLEAYGGADSCTISNVLNVIDSKDGRIAALMGAWSMMKPGAYCYITVYEGDRSRLGRQTKRDCWQNNRPIKDYLKEVKDVFQWAACRNGVIIAQK